MRQRTFHSTQGSGLEVGFPHRLAEACWRLGMSVGTAMMAGVQVWSLLKAKTAEIKTATPPDYTDNGFGGPIP